MTFAIEMASILEPRRQSSGSLSTPISPSVPPASRRWEPDLFPVPPSSAGTMGGESIAGTAADGSAVGSNHGQPSGAEGGDRVDGGGGLGIGLLGPGPVGVGPLGGEKRPMPTMDDYMFREHVKGCKVVSEDTTYLEIFNYEGSQPDYCEAHPLPPDEFDNFFNRTGVFSPPKLKKDSKLLNGTRLVIQTNAKDPETFSPYCISLPHEIYEKMVRGMSLPFRAIELTAVVGPFFWSSFDQDDLDPHLLIVFRKSDVRKKGLTRGWEMMLSYSFQTHITSGYVKGTKSSDIKIALQHLQACAKQAMHPMLAPIILLSMDMSGKDEVRQREARDWVRRLENAISMRDEIDRSESLYLKDGVIDLDAINRDLVECHSQVLWKRPRAYKEVIREIERGMDRFAEKAAEWKANEKLFKSGNADKNARLWSGEEESSTDEDEEVVERSSIGSGESGGRRKRKNKKIRNRMRFSDETLDLETRSLHRSMLGRLEFYTCKLMGIENYSYTTLERLNIQREVLYSIHARTGSKLGLKMAGEQKRLSHASKRDSAAMKSLSLMGALFLPATFISSIFSMTFFDFQVGDNSPDGEYRTLSPDVWIYFVVTLPITFCIVAAWWWWDVRRENKYKEEDDTIDNEIGQMEKEIIKSMRMQTSVKANTWETGRRETIRGITV